mgnify:CR=1 FL=1
MNYVFYDFETSGNNKDFDQILQIGAVLTDEGFHIKDKINISCRLKKNIIPAPEALLINRISIDQLQSNKITHYELLEQLRKKFEEWSPACFVGFNSISFDEDVLRQGLFQSFNFPYLTSVKGNCRLDVLKLARAVSAFAPNSIAVPLSEDNKPKQDTIAKLTAKHRLRNIPHPRTLHRPQQLPTQPQSPLRLSGRRRKRPPRRRRGLLQGGLYFKTRLAQ